MRRITSQHFTTLPPAYPGHGFTTTTSARSRTAGQRCSRSSASIKYSGRIQWDRRWESAGIKNHFQLRSGRNQRRFLTVSDDFRCPATPSVSLSRQNEQARPRLPGAAPSRLCATCWASSSCPRRHNNQQQPMEGPGRESEHRLRADRGCPKIASLAALAINGIDTPALIEALPPTLPCLPTLSPATQPTRATCEGSIVRAGAAGGGASGPPRMGGCRRRLVVSTAPRERRGR